MRLKLAHLEDHIQKLEDEIREKKKLEDEIAKKSEGQKWNSVDRTILGSLPTVANAPRPYDLSSHPESNAKLEKAEEVLLHVEVFTGNGRDGNKMSKGKRLWFKIWTRERDREYYKALSASTFFQSAFSYNSTNTWLPLTDDLTIFAELRENDLIGNADSSISVIGYR